MVLARGEPGPVDLSGGVEWRREMPDEITVDDTAIWVIGADGSVKAGPTIDGTAGRSSADLLGRLRSMPDASMAPPDRPARGGIVATLGIGLLLVGLMFRRLRRR